MARILTSPTPLSSRTTDLLDQSFGAAAGLQLLSSWTAAAPSKIDKDQPSSDGWSYADILNADSLDAATARASHRQPPTPGHKRPEPHPYHFTTSTLENGPLDVKGSSCLRYWHFIVAASVL